MVNDYQQRCANTTRSHLVQLTAAVCSVCYHYFPYIVDSFEVNLPPGTNYRHRVCAVFSSIYTLSVAINRLSWFAEVMGF